MGRQSRDLGPGGPEPLHSGRDLGLRLLASRSGRGCCFKAPGLWQFVRTATRNQYSNLTQVPVCLGLRLSFCKMDIIRQGLRLD